MEIQIQEDKYSLEFSIKNNLPYLLGLFLFGVCVYVFIPDPRQFKRFPLP